MEKKSGREISDDEAEIILDQLARLGVVAVKSLEEKKKASKHFNINH